MNIMSTYINHPLIINHKVFLFFFLCLYKAKLHQDYLPIKLSLILLILIKKNIFI